MRNSEPAFLVLIYRHALRRFSNTNRVKTKPDDAQMIHFLCDIIPLQSTERPKTSEIHTQSSSIESGSMMTRRGVKPCDTVFESKQLTQCYSNRHRR